MKNTLHIRIHSITLEKTIYRIQHKKKNKSRKKNGDKNAEAL